MTTTQSTTRGRPEPEPESEIRLPRVSIPSIVLVLCVPLAVAASLAAMTFGGGFSTGTALLDPGPIVDKGLPIVRAIHDTAAAGTVGLLVLAAFVLPGQTKVPGEVGRSQWRAVRWAAWAGAVWFVAACVVIVLTGIQVSGVAISDPLFPSAFTTFLFQIELGQSLVVSAGCVLVATVIALFANRLTSVGVAAGFALFALLPLALSGHAAGSFEHANAVDSLAVHLVGVTVWVGGLAGLLLLRTTVKRGFGVAVARYSTLAGWAFVAVGFSGVVNAALRLNTFADLLAPYGLLIVAKASILVILGFAGALQRKRVIPALKADPMNRRLFVRLAVSEVVFMTLAIGIAVGLAKSPPPVSQAPLTGDAARAGLLGFPYPPPVTMLRMFTVWHWEWMWLGLAIVLAGCYLWAARVLRRRGDHWPIYRSICWVAGCAVLVWATSGGPAVYGLVHFSSHMVEHMALMMFIPPLLVLGGPVLLALRALPSRHDGSRGIREWLLLFTHSRFLGFLAQPVVAGVIFAGSLIVFYYSPAFYASLSTHEWHVLMYVHFLLSGYLFFWVFIGIDPGPKRPPYPILFMVLLATLAFHAFFGVALMMSDGVLAADWYHALGQTNTAALLADQHTGGGIAWGASEIPMVLVALGVATMWAKSDERTAKRLDRQADRDGDAELVAYNARLENLQARDGDDDDRRDA
ncbi:cytochrome c oxidase assembly protein [Rathayibacter soli]|uniref:cytochrome c oxidase assembly protein n=1 Tax=Rathayibacter soli TaxID=3144168 RepID=UPI0027E45AF5|nr:cytochrome c oxidase assembly protein [Glaciibacter superstes]